MGLDGVEIVMDVEDRFGISIQEAEAEHVRTVGDLVALIHGRVCAARTAGCLTLPAFLALRAVVREISGQETLRIRPRYTIAQTLTATQRCQLWRRLQQMLGSPPRELRRPPMLRYTLVLGVLSVFASSLYFAIQIDLSVVPLALVTTALFGLVAHLLTRALRTIPPDGWTTFAEVTRKLVGKTAATKQLDLRTPEEILGELRPIVTDILSVEASEVVPTARFIEDLGMS